MSGMARFLASGEMLDEVLALLPDGTEVIDIRESTRSCEGNREFAIVIKSPSLPVGNRERIRRCLPTFRRDRDGAVFDSWGLDQEAML